MTLNNWICIYSEMHKLNYVFISIFFANREAVRRRNFLHSHLMWTESARSWVIKADYNIICAFHFSEFSNLYWKTKNVCFHTCRPTQQQQFACYQFTFHFAFGTETFTHVIFRRILMNLLIFNLRLILIFYCSKTTDGIHPKLCTINGCILISLLM